MKAKGALFTALVLLLFFPAQSQQDVTITSLDQKFFIRENGVVESIWKVTLRVEKKTEAFSFYLNFGTRSYVRDLVALGSMQQPLKTLMVSSESLPLFNVFPPRPLEKEDFTFTVRFIIWEAVTSVGDAGSFDFATGFLYPIEELNLLISSPPSSRITNYFPGGGESLTHSNLPAVKWNITSIPAGKNLQIKLEFLHLKTNEADMLFTDALALYDARKWEEAEKKFADVLEKYILLGDKKRAEECNGYIGKIKDIREAENLLQEAEQLSGEEKYSMAQQKYRQAKSLLLKSGLGEEGSRIDDAINKTARYEAAQEWMSRAEDAAQKKDYIAATTFYRNAIKIYADMDDEGKVAEIEKIIETLKPSPPRNLLIPGVLIFVLVCVVVAILILRRKPSIAPALRPSSAPQSSISEDKKKTQAKLQMQTCPFCGREIPKSATVCPHCSQSLSETKEELLRRKDETQKTIDELEKSYIAGLVSEEEYKKLRKKWINTLVDIEDKLISYEVKKGR